MNRNEYKQYVKWQASGKQFPPNLSNKVRYFYLKKPNWERLFKEHSNFPSKPNENKESSSIGNYLFYIIESIFEDIGSSIGLFMFIGLPILLVDFIFSKGLLSISILGVGYYFYNKNICENNKYIDQEIQSYELKLAQWRQSTGINISKFRDEQFFDLESYFDNKIGRSVPRFHENLKQAGIVGILEAIPKDNPYQFRNGVYSADIGYVNRKDGVLLDIEVDEDHHFADFEQWKRDRHRNTFFSENGWAVVRFVESEITNNPDQCILDIVNIVSELRTDFSNFVNNMIKL
jgi:hypothetical protein